MDTFVLDLLILLDYTNLFSPNDYEKNGKVIYLDLYNYIENLKSLKYTS